jgi:hypothetical protein
MILNFEFLRQNKLVITKKWWWNVVCHIFLLLSKFEFLSFVANWVLLLLLSLMSLISLMSLLSLLSYHKSQTRRARELKFWENVHPPQHVTCHMSHVTCHMSYVTCNVSCVTCHIFYLIFFRTKWWGLSMEGLLSTRPTPSSFKGIRPSRPHFSPNEVKNLSDC